MQAYEFYDLDGKLFTAHFLRATGENEFQMICDGIPVEKGWRIHRRGKWWTVESVAGKLIRGLADTLGGKE